MMVIVMPMIFVIKSRCIVDIVIIIIMGMIVMLKQQ